MSRSLLVGVVSGRISRGGGIISGIVALGRVVAVDWDGVGRSHSEVGEEGRRWWRDKTQGINEFELNY